MIWSARLQLGARSLGFICLLVDDADGSVGGSLVLWTMDPQVNDCCFLGTVWLQTRMVHLLANCEMRKHIQARRARTTASHSFTVSQLRMKSSMTRHDAMRRPAGCKGWSAAGFRLRHEQTHKPARQQTQIKNAKRASKSPLDPSFVHTKGSLLRPGVSPTSNVSICSPPRMFGRTNPVDEASHGESVSGDQCG